MITISEAMQDAQIFGPALGDPAPWAPWRAILKAAFAEPLTADERAIFDQVAGGREPPAERVSELWVVAGRRGGKSRMAAMVATHCAAFLAPSVPLAPGEEGVVVAIGPTVKQAGKILKYAKGFIGASTVLAASVEGETRDEIRLEGDIVLSTRAADQDTVRGDTTIAAVFEEVAFWAGENSATPDVEIYNAIAPSLLTTDGMIIGISSPYAQRGLLWDRYRAHFGKPSPRVLVVMAPTWVLNPLLSRDHHLIAARYEEDPLAAAAEHGERFRTDVETFVSRQAVEACVSEGVVERPRVGGVRYSAFVDAAGGSGKDSFTLAIGHSEGGRAVLDVVRERKPPFAPEAVVEEYAELMRAYGIYRAEADRWGSEWVREAFGRHRVNVEQCAKPKSELYKDLLPALNSRLVDLLDHGRLISQIVSLERSTARGGRETIDHPPNGHDDVGNAVAGLVAMVSTGRRQGVSMVDYL
ncbi:hypothetical protein ACTZWW_03105 [Salinarimonas sp. NSM]|uniref:hypothetical protein n=1 Tax=Salinarimonas sp. NSM TaxID=3458003 RepID=UPI004036445C